MVSLKDSSVTVGQNKYYSHRIFGYEKPDSTSKRLLVISAFTTDVEGNIFKCSLGAYYTTYSMELNLKYVSSYESYVKVAVIKDGIVKAFIYLQKMWVEYSYS